MKSLGFVRRSALAPKNEDFVVKLPDWWNPHKWRAEDETGNSDPVGHGYVLREDGRYERTKLPKEEYRGLMKRSLWHVVDGLLEHCPTMFAQYPTSPLRAQRALIAMLHLRPPLPLLVHLHTVGHRSMRFAFETYEELDETLEALLDANSCIFTTTDVYRRIIRHLHFNADAPEPAEPNSLRFQVIFAYGKGDNDFVGGFSEFTLDTLAMRVSELAGMEGHRFYLYGNDTKTTLEPVSVLMTANSCKKCGNHLFLQNLSVYDINSSFFKIQLEHFKKTNPEFKECTCTF